MRTYLGLTQQQLAKELSLRQQTISEWETGRYHPRDASITLLNALAERSGYAKKFAATQPPKPPRRRKPRREARAEPNTQAAPPEKPDPDPTATV